MRLTEEQKKMRREFAEIGKKLGKERGVVEVPFCIPDINQEDKDSVVEALDSRWLTGGQRTVEFEKRFADYVGVKYAVAVNSCTAALHLAMRALNIGEGDEVIVPTFTFAATANAPIFCGAKPVFADIDENTLNISPESIVEKITKRTKGVIPVHIAGICCDMEEILKVAMVHNLYIIEDCAHSLGATYKGETSGSLSHIACFSFYPTKPLVTGEGGMLVTNSGKFAKRAKLMRSHCITKEAWERQKSASWEYDVVGLGYNYRMTEFQAALGLSQLSRLDEMNGKRAKIAEHYNEKLCEVKGIITPKLAENRTTSNHLYIIRVVEKEFGMSRDQLFSELAERGIECSVHYTPLHRMSFYRERYGYKASDFPVAERVYPELLSLPLFSLITQDQAEYVVNCIEELAK